MHDPEWIEQSSCGAAARHMLERGYAYDYISDRQVSRTRFEDGMLRTEGGNTYRTLLVPAARYLPLDTARRLLALADAGATVLFWQGLPHDVPGWHDQARGKEQLGDLFAPLSWTRRGKAAWGRGTLVVSDDLEQLLEAGGAAREPLVDHGLRGIRRVSAHGTTYFIANQSAHPVNDWVALAAAGSAALLMDPMTARTGLAPLRPGNDGGVVVRLQMEPGETRLLRVLPDVPLAAPRWPVREVAGEPTAMDGLWRVEYVEGGPVLPAPTSTRELKCWTQLGDDEAVRFAGAARYHLTFPRPDDAADGWYLELGDVRESARVWVNDTPAGVALAHPFRIDLGRLVRPGDNTLCIEVTNLSANRIRDLDRRGVAWKKFHDINFVDHRYQPFDAANWNLTPSGLLGPVRLVPYRVAP